MPPLLDLLDSVSVREFDLLVEKPLLGLLGAVVSFSALREHGVRAVAPLTPQAPAGPKVVLLSPAPTAIAEASLLARQSSPTVLVFVPEVPQSARTLLTEYGVLGDVEVRSWPLPPLVKDACVPGILSMFSGSTSNSNVEWQMAYALNKMQLLETGLFLKTTGVGPRGREVLRLLREMKAEHAVRSQSEAFEHQFGYASDVFAGEEVQHLIVIDRNIDDITPLVLQTTYAGVLAETVGIDSSGVANKTQTLKNDELFAKLAESPFSAACDEVYALAKQLQQESAELQQHQTDSLAQLGGMVKQLGSLNLTKQLVNSHTDTATRALAMLGTSGMREVFALQADLLANRLGTSSAVARIQDLIFQQQPLEWVLRILALLARLRDGLKEQIVKALCLQDICRTYGYETMPRVTKLNLDSKPQYSFSQLNRQYKLFPGLANQPESAPYTNYVPLTARIAQLAVGALPLQGTVLEGEFETSTATPADRHVWREAKLRRTLAHNTAGHEQQVVLVAIVGGVTYAECAAIKRALEQRNLKVVVAANTVFTGSDAV